MHAFNVLTHMLVAIRLNRPLLYLLLFSMADCLIDVIALETNIFSIPKNPNCQRNHKLNFLFKSNSYIFILIYKLNIFISRMQILCDHDDSPKTKNMCRLSRQQHEHIFKCLDLKSRPCL